MNYYDSAEHLISKNQLKEMIYGVNQIWSVCNISFKVDKFRFTGDSLYLDALAYYGTSLSFTLPHLKNISRSSIGVVFADGPVERRGKVSGNLIASH